MRITWLRACTLALGSLALFALLLGACVPPYSATPSTEIPNLSDHQIVNDGHRLHYVEAGTPGKPLIIFIHGTPGSWQAFSVFLQNPELAANTHMLAIDRPGLGASAASGVQPDFAKQAQAVARLFTHNQSGKPSILVGHSLGGSIAFRVAVDHPAEVGGLLSVSSSINPALGKPRWYNRLASLPIVRWLVRGDLSIANAEVMALQSQLAAMEQAMQALPIPVTLLQGEQDLLVSPANADYARDRLQSQHLRVISVPQAGHFLIWEQPQRVVDAIIHLAQIVKPAATAPAPRSPK